jgi:hypothetical protein
MNKLLSLSSQNHGYPYIPRPLPLRSISLQDTSAGDYMRSFLFMWNLSQDRLLDRDRTKKMFRGDKVV